MPLSTQALYFHLVMNANDKGILNNANSVVRCVDADSSDLTNLLEREYVYYDGSHELHISHWVEHLGIGEVHKDRNNYSYRKWREMVLIRDNYTCQKCGAKNNLHVHHKKSSAENPELRLKLDNGITLCVDCHRKINGLVKKEK
jgi:nitrate/TMAO reductase-like tetraheme cytochrome c subunit